VAQEFVDLLIFCVTQQPAGSVLDFGLLLVAVGQGHFSDRSVGSRHVSNHLFVLQVQNCNTKAMFC
jgi:hypothetical protein